MQEQDNRSNQKDTALQRAIRHPKRLKILGLLAEEKSGVEEDELAEALDLPLPGMRYHLKILQSADLVAHIEGSVHGAADRYIAVHS